MYLYGHERNIHYKTLLYEEGKFFNSKSFCGLWKWNRKPILLIETSNSLKEEWIASKNDKWNLNCLHHTFGIRIVHSIFTLIKFVEPITT